MAFIPYLILTGNTTTMRFLREMPACTPSHWQCLISMVVRSRYECQTFKMTPLPSGGVVCRPGLKKVIPFVRVLLNNHIPPIARMSSFSPTIETLMSSAAKSNFQPMLLLVAEVSTILLSW